MSDLQNKIMDSIQTKKPQSKWLFLLRNVFFAIVIIGSIIVAGLALGEFWVDFGELDGIIKVNKLHFWKYITEGSFELLILTLLGFSGSYFIYETTDWILVRYRKILVGVFLGSILIVGSIYFAVQVNFKNDNFRLRQIHYMHRQNRGQLKMPSHN
jgi:hypothetical protein